ncbi:unnamed protein product, partial [Staurois parvus]
SHGPRLYSPPPCQSDPDLPSVTFPIKKNNININAAGMVGTPHNGHRGCTELGTDHRDGGNPS